MFVTISWKSWLSHCGSLCVLPQGTSHWVLACSCKVCDQPHTIHARTPFSIKTGSCQPSAGQHHRLNGEAFESHRCKADQNSHTQMMPPTFFIVFSCSCFTSISTLKSTMQKDLLKLRHPKEILSKDHELALGPHILGLSQIFTGFRTSKTTMMQVPSWIFTKHRRQGFELKILEFHVSNHGAQFFSNIQSKTTHPFPLDVPSGVFKAWGGDKQTPWSRSEPRIHLHGLTWSSSRLIFRAVNRLTPHFFLSMNPLSSP